MIILSILGPVVFDKKYRIDFNLCTKALWEFYWVALNDYEDNLK